jgi:hypothetical protein
MAVDCSAVPRSVGGLRCSPNPARNLGLSCRAACPSRPVRTRRCGQNGSTLGDLALLDHGRRSHSTGSSSAGTAAMMALAVCLRAGVPSSSRRACCMTVGLCAPGTRAPYRSPWLADTMISSIGRPRQQAGRPGAALRMATSLGNPRMAAAGMRPEQSVRARRMSGAGRGHGLPEDPQKPLGPAAASVITGNSTTKRRTAAHRARRAA